MQLCSRKRELAECHEFNGPMQINLFLYRKTYSTQITTTEFVIITADNYKVFANFFYINM